MLVFDSISEVVFCKYKDRQCTYDIALRRVHVIIAAVEEQ